jgi:MYXO-CTERM domain-containing protein
VEGRGDPEPEEGCSCRAAGSSGPRGAAPLALALLLVFAARRRWRLLQAPACAAAALLASLGALSGCQILGGYEQFTLGPDAVAGGTGGATDSGAPEGSAGAPQGCADASLLSSVKGGSMRLLEYGTGCFWMDETEVSRAQYEEFLDDAPAPQTDEACRDNGSLSPAPVGVGATECWKPERVTVSDAGDHPVVCIDWCDARAYCTWAGKTLCRDAPAALVQTSDWYAACSNGGTDDYPVSDPSDGRVCNASDNPQTGCDTNNACTTVPVSELPSCHNDAGVLHLAGNVAEWTDACDGSGCMTRGGAMSVRIKDAPCDRFRNRSRDWRDATLGFRCCLRV